jgi:hypothetical protein
MYWWGFWAGYFVKLREADSGPPAYLWGLFCFGICVVAPTDFLVLFLGSRATLRP